KVLHTRHFVGPALLPGCMGLLGDVSRQVVTLDRYIQRRSKPNKRGTTRFDARAGLLERVLPFLNVFGLKLGQANLAEIRLDVPPDEDLVRRVRRRLAAAYLLAGAGVVARAYAFRHPVVEPGADCQPLIDEGDPAALAVDR